MAAWTRGVDCECDLSCVAHASGGQCHLNGTAHTHPDDGRGHYGRCPVHPHAPAAAWAPNTEEPS